MLFGSVERDAASPARGGPYDVATVIGHKKIYAKIEAWRNRRIEGEHPYLYLDGIVMKRTWAGEVRNVSLLVASAVNSEGYREIWAFAKVLRRTNPAGRRSFATSSIAASMVCSSSSPMPAAA